MVELILITNLIYKLKKKQLNQEIVIVQMLLLYVCILYRIMSEQPKAVCGLAYDCVQRLSPLVRQIDFALDWTELEAGRALYRSAYSIYRIHCTCIYIRFIHYISVRFPLKGMYDGPCNKVAGDFKPWLLYPACCGDCFYPYNVRLSQLHC